jgi:hypothetical protein
MVVTKLALMAPDTTPRGHNGVANSQRQRYLGLVSSLVRACAAAAVLTALSSVANTELQPMVAPGGHAARHSDTALLRPCPPRTLLDNQVCVPVPESLEQASEPGAGANWQIYDSIPRRPERPFEHSRYEYPVMVEQVQPSPFEGASPSQTALLFSAPLNSPVAAQELEGQVGPISVLFAGKLVGKTVVTEHRVKEAGQQPTYLVIYGNLDSINTRAGSHPSAHNTLGSVGNSASGHAVGLHLEVRRVRHGVDSRQLHSEDFLSRASTIACDPRNVFKLLPQH